MQGMNKVVVIGSGKVASCLGKSLFDSGRFEIVQIYSRSLSHAQKMASFVGNCPAIDDASCLIDADCYLVAIKDDAIAPFLSTVPDRCKGALWMHTSGSVDISVFKGFNGLNGVLYPLQTFSVDSKPDMRTIPFLIEGSSDEATALLKELACAMSSSVYEATSQLRTKIHLAAVFACNFTNCLYAIADDILKKNNIPFSILLPLIGETTRKLSALEPWDAQTGPAARGDMAVIQKHLDMLNHEEKTIYQILSDYILKNMPYERNTI